MIPRRYVIARLGRRIRGRGLRPRVLHRTDVRRGGPARSSPLRVRGPEDGQRPAAGLVSASSNGGRTWSAGKPLSVAGDNATQPRLASSGGKRAHLVHADRRPRPRRVERLVPQLLGRRLDLVGPREDQGSAGRRRRLHRRERLRRGLRRLRRHRGDEHGKTVAIWGEGFSYTGPGGSWFNIQR